MRGFTLLETIIAAGGALIIGVMLLSIMVNHNGVFYKQNSLVGEGLSINEVTRRVEESVRQSAGVVSGYPEVSPAYISGPAALVLKIPAVGSSGVIIAHIYDHVIFTADSSNPKILRYMVFPDTQSSRPQTNIVLTTLLESVQFSFLDSSGNSVAPASATAVGLKLTVLAKTGSVGEKQSSSTLTSLRNLSK